MAEKKSNNLGITSLVLGIISIVFCWVPILGLVAGIIAIVLSVKQKKIFPNGINTAGLVTGIIGSVFSVLYLIIWLIVLIGIASFAGAA